MWIHTQLCRIKERREKERKQGQDLPLRVGKLKQSDTPASGAVPVGTDGKHLRLSENEAADL